jgi:hypothetical protein
MTNTTETTPTTEERKSYLLARLAQIIWVFATRLIAPQEQTDLLEEYGAIDSELRDA